MRFFRQTAGVAHKSVAADAQFAHIGGIVDVVGLFVLQIAVKFPFLLLVHRRFGLFGKLADWLGRVAVVEQNIGLLLGLAVLLVFKQHSHVIQPHIRQIGLVLQNLAKIAHGLAVLGFHPRGCAMCVFIERGVMLGEALIDGQQCREKIPLPLQ